MPMLGDKTTILDIIPRCILGQLVRDVLGWLKVRKQRGTLYTLVQFKASLFASPAGRWALNNQEVLCTSTESVRILLPSHLLDLLTSVGYIEEDRTYVSITPHGEKALREIEEEIQKLGKELREKTRPLPILLEAGDCSGA